MIDQLPAHRLSANTIIGINRGKLERFFSLPLKPMSRIFFEHMRNRLFSLARTPSSLLETNLNHTDDTAFRH
jgi:hypothetical protein